VDLRPVLRFTGSAAACQGVATEMNARAVAAWSAACLFIVLFTTNPAYKALVLAAAIASLAAGAGLHRLRGLLIGVVLIAAFATSLNFVSAHLGATVLFELPASIPGLGGPYTFEALAAGVSGGLTVAAAIVAAAPFSLMLASHDVMDALPAALSRSRDCRLAQPGAGRHRFVRAGHRGTAPSRLASARSALVGRGRRASRPHQRGSIDPAR
jgi:hypothetical protein